MTVTYTRTVSTSTFWGIQKLLLRWKGSLWKSIWADLLIWLACYFTISIIYRFYLTSDQQKIFEDISLFFYSYADFIPLTFILGFYVSTVFGRWSQQMEHLAWVDTPALLVATHIDGNDSRSVMLRRNIIRYMVLLQAMVFRNISVTVNKRFPTMDHLVEAGLMTQNELEVFDSIVMPQLKYWVIMSWILGLLREARNKNLIKDSIIYTQILEKMMDFRATVLKLSIYDWIPIPLVYTQVVGLTVRLYFAVALFGRQYLQNEEIIKTNKNLSKVDLFLPIMTIIEFLLYMGLAKVAEVMLNPFGSDDEDFECNWLIDRNLQVGRAIVDSYCKFPILEKDVFWDEPIPEPLYTAETAARPHNPMVGSCNQLDEFEASLLQPHKDKIMPSKNKENEAVIGLNHFPRRRSSQGITQNPHLSFPEPEQIRKTSASQTADFTDRLYPNRNTRHHSLQPTLMIPTPNQLGIFDEINESRTPSPPTFFAPPHRRNSYLGHHENLPIIREESKISDGTTDAISRNSISDSKLSLMDEIGENETEKNDKKQT